MANTHELTCSAFTLRAPPAKRGCDRRPFLTVENAGVLKLCEHGLFGAETLIDVAEAVGIGCEYGEYDK